MTNLIYTVKIGNETRILTTLAEAQAYRDKGFKVETTYQYLCNTAPINEARRQKYLAIFKARKG